jgi:hypothetical protein
MNEHPILFSSEMVRVILAGKKTQTRRVIRLADGSIPDEDDIPTHEDVMPNYIMDFSKTYPFWKQLNCPYGKIGDILWVRESFSTVDKGNLIIYKADGLTAEEVGVDKITWMPSIHMPKRVCRIRLEITDIGVERVQDIRESDIEQEGITLKNDKGEYLGHQTQFKNLWDKINSKRDFSWEKNPWVWVIEFKRLQDSAEIRRLGK